MDNNTVLDIVGYNVRSIFIAIRKSYIHFHCTTYYCNTAFQFSQLTCNVTSNGITNASTINLRANSGNAGPAVSIIGSTTGTFSDNTDTYSAATTDAINYQVVTASARTSMKIAFIAVWGNSGVQITPVTKYKHFSNFPRLPFTPNLDIGNQYVTFG